jgi:hypothetical protein
MSRDFVFDQMGLYGHFELLKWAHDKGYQGIAMSLSRCRNKWSPGRVEMGSGEWEQTCQLAAENGHLEIFQWAMAWSWTFCFFAARNGHMVILPWAHACVCAGTPDSFVKVPVVHARKFGVGPLTMEYCRLSSYLCTICNKNTVQNVSEHR